MLYSLDIIWFWEISTDLWEEFRLSVLLLCWPEMHVNKDGLLVVICNIVYHSPNLIIKFIHFDINVLFFLFFASCWFIACKIFSYFLKAIESQLNTSPISFRIFQICKLFFIWVVLCNWLVNYTQQILLSLAHAQ